MQKNMFFSALVILMPIGLIFAGVDFHVNVNIGAPEIEFSEPPPVVLVTPGIYVVPNDDRELFFVGGFYWVSQEGRWFRSAGPHKKWVLVDSRKVPHGLAKIPPGKYKNWHPAKMKEGHNSDHAEERDDHDRGHGKWK